MRRAWVALMIGLAGQAAMPGFVAAQPAAERPAPGEPRTQPGASGDALIARGIRLRKSGDDRAALALFEQAYTETRSLQALAQMALAEQALGRWVAAREHLEQALSVRADAWIESHRATLEVAREEIASRLGQLEVSCNVADALVEVDGQRIGRTPLPRAVPLVVGQSVLKISAPGHFSVTRQVQVDARSLARVDIILTRVPVESGPPRAEVARVLPGAARAARDGGSAQASTARNVLMYSSLGLAALGATLGVTGYIVREINLNVYNDDSLCRVRPGVRRSLECKDEYDAWRLGQALAIAGIATAAVFGGVGLYLWLDRPEASSRHSLACGIGAGLASCTGRF